MAAPNDERLAERFHEEWLGLVQPLDGLVVSIPALVDAQCASRQSPELGRALDALCRAEDDDRVLVDLPGLLQQILGWQRSQCLVGDELPEALSLYVPEGQQTLRPTLALKSSRDGEPPILLLWDLGEAHAGLRFDKPEALTGPWDYPPAAKLDRLLRHCKIPIGLLTNRTHVRLVYAPHGESSGSITFGIADMTTVAGRPILDAFVMLLSATRLFGVAPAQQLPAILRDSRERQANVTNALAAQVKEALEILLRGFVTAAERDGTSVLDAAVARDANHVYGGLLTQLLRLVFVLYAEDQGLLPTEHEHYARHLSLLGLYDELVTDAGAYPDSMSQRFGAYGRIVALCRALYLGVDHGTLVMPARAGVLFSPHEYPFLEGWQGEPGSAPIVDPEARRQVRVPSVDDETIHRVLERLLILDRQRLSYRALDVEQIGSVYEALMGYHAERLPADAVRIRDGRVWVTAQEVLAEKPATRTKWLQERTGLAKAQAEKLNKALAPAKTEPDALEILQTFAAPGESRARAGQLVIQPDDARRHSSSHYTPRSLTTPIVHKTLEPLFAAMGEQPSSERILNLKVCDPAMGSGAFLVEACRYLGDRLVAAWTREGRADLLTGKEDTTLIARRLVAQRCLYGVDKNAYAVNLAKLSLWLVTLAKDLPFTFLDHSLRHGDSLVGLTFDQITAFHWKPQKQLQLCQGELAATLNEAIEARLRILDLAGDASPSAQFEKRVLLKDAEDALDRVRLLGDLVIGAFFSSTKDKDREQERTRRLDQVTAWLREGGPAPEALVALQQETRARLAPFHWMAEYPEVFWVQRPDPLDNDKVGDKAWIDAFVGNPPFMGGRKIMEAEGEAYGDWLEFLHAGSKNADLSAHFFRRASDLLGDHGTFGLLATNTIAQGDTRATGLQALLREGLTIYDATPSMPWPGDAAVSVAVVHLEKGCVQSLDGSRVLDGQEVQQINSRLRAGAERTDPVPLATNSDCSFQGCIVLGMGFVLTPEEREALVAKDEKNAERIFPYLGGEEVNTSPTQDFDRYVINFGDLPLEQAERWPDLLSIVREKVKPERDRVNRDAHRKYWWHYADKRPALAEALAALDRCLVCARHSKHLVFAYQPTNRVVSEATNVFALPGRSAFSVLQSRVHEGWARLLSSTMKNDMRYAASDCFETFPFPAPDPRTVIPSLEDIGQRLYDFRADYMKQTNQGLTQTYNRLKDPDCHDPEIVQLRRLHEELDTKVLAAYGWQDLAVPPYGTPTTPAEKQALATFEDTIIDRLFALNADRAAAEAAAAPKPRPKRGNKAS